MNLFFQNIKKLLGDDYANFSACYQNAPFRGIRANTLKISFERLSSLLDFPMEHTPFCGDNAYIPQTVTESLGNLPLHHAGAFYLQEPSAASAVSLLDVQKGDKVLDLCAAPGGKSTQIAAALEGTGILWSNELVRNRASVLLSNIERMGVRNAVVSSCYPETLCSRLAGCFDKILVDAPCSGEGMFRKDPDAQKEWSIEHVRACAVRQLQILNSAKNALRPGGILVYSTCTFSHEENEGVLSQFLEDNPDFELIEPGVFFGRRTMEYVVRIFPMDGGEGHFAAKLQKKGTGCSALSGFAYKDSGKEIYDFYDSLFADRPFGERLQTVQNKVYALPSELPSLEGLSVLRAGVLLGEIRKNRIEPAHHCFMAAKKTDCRQFVDFDQYSEEIKRFLHGEEISPAENKKGYTAVCVNGMTAGFGKASNGRLKNKYPKGLRIL